MKTPRKQRSDSFWTKELILKGIKALVEAGVTVNCYGLARDKSIRTSKILKETTGLDVTGAKLYSAAYKKCGGLYKAASMAGINHRDIRTDTKFWSKKDMVTAIKALNKNGICLSVMNIEKNRNPKVTSIILKSSGLRANGYKLYRKSCKTFGSWDKALLAAELDPFEIRRVNWSFDEKTLIKTIRHLNKKNLPLNIKSLENNKGNKISAELKRFLGNDIPPTKLFLSGKKKFGSWDSALMAAGLNPKKVRRDRKFWTREKMIEAIKKLDENDICLDCYTIQFDKSKKAADVVSSVVGRKSTGASLYSAVAASFGSWTRVVKAVRMNPESIGVSPKFWPKRTVIRSIKHLHKAGVALNQSSIMKDESEQTKQLIAKATSVPVSGNILYSTAIKRFDSWDMALAEASLNPALIRRRGQSVKSSGQDFTKILNTISQAGKPIYSSGVLKSSKDIKLVTYDHFKRVISGNSVIAYGRKTFSHWEDALRAAGFNPYDIVLRSRYGWTLSTIPHQVERLDLGNGLVGKVALIGEAPKNPEQILDQKESSLFLEGAMQSFSRRDRNILEEVFDTILQIDNFRNRDDLIKVIGERMGNKISEIKIKNLLDEMRYSCENTGLFL